MALWWLSFADPKRPEGERFLGVALVETEDLVEGTDPKELYRAALRKAWATDCNPGGEVDGGVLPLDLYSNAQRVKFARAPKHTLLSKEQLEELDLL